MSKDIVEVFKTVMIVEDETGEVEFGTRFNKEFLNHMNVDINKIQEKLIPIYEDILKEINEING